MKDYTITDTNNQAMKEPNASEIKSNMTPGIWEPTSTVYKKAPKRIYDGVGVCDRQDYGTWTRKVCDSILPQSDEEYINRDKNIEADMYAISNAVNNTYGKGLNPEVYEDVVNVLQELNEWHQKWVITKMESFQDALEANFELKPIREKVSEAINKARIK